MYQDSQVEIWQNTQKRRSRQNELQSPKCERRRSTHYSLFPSAKGTSFTAYCTERRGVQVRYGELLELRSSKFAWIYIECHVNTRNKSARKTLKQASEAHSQFICSQLSIANRKRPPSPTSIQTLNETAIQYLEGNLEYNIYSAELIALYLSSPERHIENLLF